MTGQPRATDLQEKINTSWNERAAEAHGTPHHAMQDEAEQKLWMDQLRPLLPQAPAEAIDVGTGTGFLAWVMADLGHNVTGFDLSEGMLSDGRAMFDDRARVSPAVRPPEFRVGDAMDPPMPPASLDLVANRNVTWTLIDPLRALRNWRALLRPGGRVLMVHGVRLDEHTGEEKADHPESPYYTAEVMARLLPIRYRPTLDPVVPVLHEAGFTDINIVRWKELERFYQDRDRRQMHWLALTGSPRGR